MAVMPIPDMKVFSLSAPPGRTLVAGQRGDGAEFAKVFEQSLIATTGEECPCPLSEKPKAENTEYGGEVRGETIVQVQVVQNVPAPAVVTSANIAVLKQVDVVVGDAKPLVRHQPDIGVMVAGKVNMATIGGGQTAAVIGPASGLDPAAPVESKTGTAGGTAPLLALTPGWSLKADGSGLPPVTGQPVEVGGVGLSLASGQSVKAGRSEPPPATGQSVEIGGVGLSPAPRPSVNAGGDGLSPAPGQSAQPHSFGSVPTRALTGDVESVPIADKAQPFVGSSTPGNEVSTTLPGGMSAGDEGSVSAYTKPSGLPAAEEGVMTRAVQADAASVASDSRLVLAPDQLQRPELARPASTTDGERSDLPFAPSYSEQVVEDMAPDSGGKMQASDMRDLIMARASDDMGQSEKQQVVDREDGADFTPVPGGGAPLAGLGPLSSSSGHNSVNVAAATQPASNALPMTQVPVAHLNSELVKFAGGGGGRAVMEITSPDLGALKIDLNIDGKGVARMVVEASTSAARDQLEQGMRRLHEDFSSIGLSLNVDVRQGGQGFSQRDFAPLFRLTGMSESETGSRDAMSRASRPVPSIISDDDKSSVHFYA